MRQNTGKFIILSLKVDPSLHTDGNPTETASEALQNLILNPAPPRGEPFPKVPGPKKDDKVMEKIRELETK